MARTVRPPSVSATQILQHHVRPVSAWGVVHFVIGKTMPDTWRVHLMSVYAQIVGKREGDDYKAEHEKWMYQYIRLIIFYITPS